MSGYEAACGLLPESIRAAVRQLPGEAARSACEFRLRLGRRPSVTMPEGERDIPGTDRVGTRDLARVLEIATQASPYSAAAAVAQGYVSAPGGVRVGLCGRMRRGAESAWTHAGLTSVAIRIPREVKGCGEAFCARPFHSTLIFSPPGAGKTTLLRDMVRLLSDGGERVSLCDERGEVAAISETGFGFDVGGRTDVLSDRPRHEAALQLLRTMNPQILAMDEITDPEDAAACRSAAGCGVALLVTAHGDSLAELREKPVFRQLFEEGVFSRAIGIRMGPRGREYREAAL